jgi:hypothetical protein
VLLFGYEVNASLHYGQKLEAVRSNLKKNRLDKAMR